MPSERVYSLDPQTLQLFAEKGTQLFAYKRPEEIIESPQVGEINAVKVRRVMQLLRDYVPVPIDQLQVYDFGCAEGVYAIEAALRGARVRAFDGRSARMDLGRAAAQRLDLGRLHFELADIRQVTAASHGPADVVLLLGILYHLTAADLVQVLANVRGLCRRFAIIETRVTTDDREHFLHEGVEYRGGLVREHGDDDSRERRDGRLLGSLDNSHSFWPDRASLYRLLAAAGFSSVCECQVPLYPGMPDDRVMLVARCGEPVQVSAYPWLNDLDEEAIADRLSRYRAVLAGRPAGDMPGG